MTKTTQHHFRLFQTEVLKLIEEFGLGEWRVFFGHVQLEGIFAECVHNAQNHRVTFFLNTHWENEIRSLTDNEIKRTALHEVLHLVLARLEWLGTLRYLNANEIGDEDEAVVCRLENYLIKHGKRKV